MYIVVLIKTLNRPFNKIAVFKTIIITYLDIYLCNNITISPASILCVCQDKQHRRYLLDTACAGLSKIISDAQLLVYSLL